MPEPLDEGSAEDREWFCTGCRTNCDKCFAMKKLVLPIALSLFVTCGCAHHYVMKLNNGMQIVTASKPRPKGGYYYYKDALGRENAIPQGRVLVIEPASMAKEETPRFKPTPEK